ncbi:hypothetical protein [Lentzea sp. NPDC003310]|uniref:hypothetical protein n=1 Tax=Lentzea sp. NPDC003310 TaxID=3154447 RepID=UPI0033BB7005
MSQRASKSEEPKAKRLKWFFSDPKGSSCFTSLSVAVEDAPVHAVLRAESGKWHFLSEADVNGEEEGYAMSTLGFMVEHYPNLVPLYALEKKWAAVWDPSTNFWQVFEAGESWGRFVDRTKV